MPTKRTRKPNPPDATLRNIRASRKRELALRFEIGLLEARVTAIEATLIRRFSETEPKSRRRE